MSLEPGVSREREYRAAAEARLKEVMRDFPWDERGFLAWSLGDGEGGTTFVIARYQARRLLLALFSELEATQKERDEAIAALKDAMPYVNGVLLDHSSSPWRRETADPIVRRIFAILAAAAVSSTPTPTKENA